MERLVSILISSKIKQMRNALPGKHIRGMLTALILSGLATTAEAQRPNQEIQVGRWTISNVGQMPGGSVCTASTTFNDGGAIGIMSEGSIAEIFVGQSGLRTTNGTKYDVAYSFDGGRWIRATGEGGQGNILMIPMAGALEAALRDFADMDELDLQLPNNLTVSRSLSGSAAAVTALRRCIRG